MSVHCEGTTSSHDKNTLDYQPGLLRIWHRQNFHPHTHIADTQNLNWASDCVASNFKHYIL